MKLLCLSNGHGEDAIALRIIHALQHLDHPPNIAALPLVGEGQVYVNANIPIIGPVKAMPSGGFVYMDGKQLARDVQGGLINLTIAQIKALREWSNTGGAVLAVGDIVPLLFAWMSGRPYGFVGTAKSEYYLRDENGPIPRLSWFDHLERWSGSVYLPWERWLMSRPRCKAVIPRDTITTTILKQWKIPAYDLGNPMMDQLSPTHTLTLPSVPTEYAPSNNDPATLKITLIPGSRAPEAYRNWHLILQAIPSIRTALPQRSLIFLAAIAPNLDLDAFQSPLAPLHWQLVQTVDSTLGFILQETQGKKGQTVDVVDAAKTTHPSSQETQSTIQSPLLLLTHKAFNDCIHHADVAIALAGTATEQVVGLGKPVITIPGAGPQFTPAFAEAQTRLLGPSIISVPSPHQVGDAIASLLNNLDQQAQIKANGFSRMGQPGASKRIAQCLMTTLQN